MRTVSTKMFDVCVVGAGPVGLAAALGCAGRGLSVLVVEAGGPAPAKIDTATVMGTELDRAHHAGLDVAVARAVGGTTWLWGGRCLPLDEIDYKHRPDIGSAGWPIGHEALAPYSALAADHLDCGSDVFDVPSAPGWEHLNVGVHYTSLERWSRQPKLASRLLARVRAAQRIELLLDHTLTHFVFSRDGGRIEEARLYRSGGGETFVRARNYVLAAGGLGTTRILLNAQEAHPDKFGGKNGALGRFYMGHLRGYIADVQLRDPASGRQMDFLRDATGAYVRRHFSIDPAILEKENMLNIHLWVDNPAFHNARHRNGVLSMVFLALATPPIGRRLVAEAMRQLHLGPRPRDYWAHLRNVTRAPLSTTAEIAGIFRDRYMSEVRRPGFLLYNHGGRYALTYHCEQAGRDGSRITLSSPRDPSGLRKIAVAQVYGDDETRTIVRAHELLDATLRRSGIGQLDYLYDISERVPQILKQANDGYHQIGTTRMGSDPATSVVDGHCRVHDVGNLYVASSSVFPSSSHANPTFAATELAFRLADHLAGRERAPSKSRINADAFSAAI